VHARFVVGADGTRSTVRAALGIGTAHLGTWAHAVQVLFRPDPPLLPARPPAHLRRRAAPGALCRWARAAGPTSPALRRHPPGRPGRLDADAARRDRLPDLSPRCSTCQRFTLAAEVATTYRAGPGFLVGDAAHRTTPVAGSA
jgi:2-polyprenyl-6-methoxyphenol hydroxylase-like FAD-dependent oxidoreductase